MVNYNTPKNFKRGRLIANKYRKIDLIVTSVCCLFSIISIIVYLFFEGKKIFIVILLLFPALVTITMITPVYFYHNWYEYSKLYFIYMMQNKKYIWEGIYKYEEIED